jgi:predicted nicotinamide N-methyase
MYDDLREAQRKQPWVFGTLMICTLGLFLLIQSGYIGMIFMDFDDEAEEIRNPNLEYFKLTPEIMISIRTATDTNESGTTVWHSGRILSQYLKRLGTKKSDPLKPLSGQSVVDLGSGTGIVGLSAAALGADAYLTDVEAVVNEGTLAQNVQRNSSVRNGSCSVYVLDWNDSLVDSCPANFGLPLPESIDLVTGADITYHRNAIKPLVSTISKLGPRKVLIALERRDPLVIEEFLQRLKDEGYDAKKVRGKDLEPTAENVEVWSFKNKSKKQ